MARIAAAWLATAWLAAGPALADTFHVATGGDDSGPGTESEPWETIQKAADTLVAGDVVLIHAGTYNEWVVIDRRLISLMRRSRSFDSAVISAIEMKSRAYKPR